MRKPLHLSPALLGIVAFAALSLLYVWQVTAMSMANYAKNELTRTRMTLVEETEGARREALAHQSLARLEERLQELQLVRATSVEYATREEMRTSLSQR